MQIQPDLGTVIAYIGLLIITWYTVVWCIRFLMSIIWPLFFIFMAIILLRILQYYEPEEIAAIVEKSLTIMADTLLLVFTKVLEGIASVIA